MSKLVVPRGDEHAHEGGSPALRGLIDASAEALRAGAPVFTRRNLYFEVRRAGGPETTEARFDAALRRRLAQGAVQGLLPERSGKGTRRAPKGSEAAVPKAVLLVDRPAILELFLALARERASDGEGLAVVCIDGTPAPVIAGLARSFREGLRVPVLYLHDAATIVYPFTVEPLATLVSCMGDEPMDFRDLGLPPLGAPPRRFGRFTSDDALVVELEEIPPAALLRYVAKAADAGQ